MLTETTTTPQQYLELLYVDGNVTLTQIPSTTIAPSCINITTPNTEGVIRIKNGAWVCDTPKNTINSIKAQNTFYNVRNLPVLNIKAILVNPIIAVQSFIHTISASEILEQGDYSVFCNAFNEAQEPVQIHGKVQDRNIILSTTSSTTLTATLTLYKV